MIEKLKAAWLRLRFGITADDYLLADYETLVRSARRCAYDFSHAADSISPERAYGIDWSGRARHWTQLFAKGNPGKDYRLELHFRVDEAEDAAKELYEIVEKAGLVHQVSLRTQNARCLLPF